MPSGSNIIRHLERGMGPTHGLARAGDFLIAKGGAMGARGACLGRGAAADLGARRDQRGSVALPRRFDSGGDSVWIMAVNPYHVPAVGDETGALVIADTERGRAINSDFVVVKQHDQLAQPQVPGQ